MLKKYLMILGVVSGLIAMPAAHAADKDAKAAIQATVTELFSGGKADSIQPSALEGIYEVTIGNQLLYVSADGRYVLSGELLDIKERRNLTAERRQGLNKKLLDNVAEDSMIIFAPKKVKHTVTVFTDIDCVYCRKLHHEIKQYNDAGIAVRYLAFPRAGMGSPSYHKAVSVWCADDRNAAMTKAKNEAPVPNRTCENPVQQHMMIAGQLGVNATPTIVLPNGRVQPGYVPADKLLKILEQN